MSENTESEVNEPETADKSANEPTSIEDQIIEQLQTVYDPEIPVDIHKLGLIYGVEVSEEGDAKVTMTLTAPNCPAAQSLPEEVKEKTESVDGVRSAEVDVVFDPPWTTEKMDDAAKLVLNIL